MYLNFGSPGLYFFFAKERIPVSPGSA